MFHPDFVSSSAGLPPSILSAAAGRAARLAGISVTDLLAVDAAHEKASIITATLEKVQAQYAKKKAASRDRRTATRSVNKAAVTSSPTASTQSTDLAVVDVPSVISTEVVTCTSAAPEPVVTCTSAAQGLSNISIVGAEPSPPPLKTCRRHQPPPRPSRPAPAEDVPSSSTASGAAPTPAATSAPSATSAEEEASSSEEEEESSSEEESESSEEESEEDYEPPLMVRHYVSPPRTLSRLTRSVAAPKKSSGANSTRARWGL